MPKGILISVTLAAQGVMKKHPTSSGFASCARQNSRRATMAATSMGWRTSMMCGINSGKRTRIKRTMAGHADEMTG